MRRFLLGSILFSWIAFLASVTVGGLGHGGIGLLQELQRMLMEFPVFPMAFETARAILTGVVVATLSVTLWALMIAVTSSDNEHRERVMSVAAGFGLVLAVTSVWMIAAALSGAGEVAGMLFAIQVATLLSMFAAGGVEFAWEALLPASATETEEDGFAARFAKHLATSSARLAAMTQAGRDGE
jgi:cytochrome bd-type quinol oxidase subunit 2